jgi:hypothetical protein
MARISSTLLMVFLAFSIGGCTSYFKRKECEKTNWYEHGQKVAMSGKRLDADPFVKECQKVEAEFSFSELDTGFKAGMAKYCTGDNVFQVGKSGKPFSYEMCDGESEKKMKARYTEGLRIFCTPGNAFRFGSSGGIYENVCPKNEEDAWLTEYRKGRKIWLKAVIEEKTREVARMDGEIQGLERQRSNLTFQQSNLTRSKTMKREHIYDPATRTYREVVSQEQDERTKQRQDELSRDISSVDYQIRSKRKLQEDLNAELSKLRTEMATL